MGRPAFDVVFVWKSSVPNTAIAQFFESLVDLIPRDQVVISVIHRAGGVSLHLNIAFSLYGRPLLKDLEARAISAKSEFAELARIREDQRAPFRATFLTPQSGEPQIFESFGVAARALRERPVPAAAPAPAPAPERAAANAPPDRRAPRFDVNLAVEFKTDDELKQEHATNISKGGLFIRTALRPALNSIARVSVRLPNGASLEALARVAHLQDQPPPGGIGVAFEPSDGSFNKKLGEYLATLPPKG